MVAHAIIFFMFGKVGNKDYGKCATIYLPASVFVNYNLELLLNDIDNALSNYKKVGDKIFGDKKINSKIFYRYELSKPIDPTIGIDDDEYQKLYQGNRGYYNIKGNPDPFEDHVLWERKLN
jgi:hypothetical protein